MSGHTPAPWYAITHEGGDFTCIAKIPHVVPGSMDLDHEILGTSEWLRVKPEDFMVMAAAADLLECLELVTDLWRGGYPAHGPEFRDVIALADIAITKAKGE